MFLTFSTMLFLAVAAPVPDPTKGPKPPSITFQGIGKNGAAVFEVTNPNAEPLPYVGYEGGVSPLYQIELMQAKTWKAHQMGWCGTGVGPVTIAAKGKATFTVELPPGAWDEFRVGLRWYKGAERKGTTETSWSDGVTRAAAPPKK